MRLTDFSLAAFCLAVASFTLAAPYSCEDNALCPAGAVLSKRQATNSSGGNNDGTNENGDGEDNEDEDEEVRGEDENPEEGNLDVPEQAQPLDPSNQVPEDIQVPGDPSQPEQQPGLTRELNLPAEIYQIINLQANLQVFDYIQRQALFEDLIIMQLVDDIPLLSQESARRIVEDVLTVVRYSERFSDQREYFEAEFNELDRNVLAQQLDFLRRFIRENTALLQSGQVVLEDGNDAEDLLRLADRHTQLLANVSARDGMMLAEVESYLRELNPYISEARLDEIVNESIQYYRSTGGGPSAIQRLRNWLRNRGGGDSGDRR